MEQSPFQRCNLCLTNTCQQNPMRVIPTCRHSMCEGCLNEIIGKQTTSPIRFRCPFDQLQSTFYSKDFSNPTYLQSQSKSEVHLKNSLSNSGTQEEDTKENKHMQYATNCKQHNQPIVLWCHEDRKLVCPKCALFSHAEHSVEPLEQAKYEPYECSKELLNLLQTKQSLIAEAASDALKREARREFETKRKVVVRDVKKWFMGLYEMLAEAEKSCFEKVDRCFKRLEQRYANKLNTGPINRDMDVWEEQVIDQLKINEQTSTMDRLVMHMKLLDEGHFLMERLGSHVSQAKKTKQHIKDCVVLGFDARLEKTLKELPMTFLNENPLSAGSIKEIYQNARKSKMPAEALIQSANEDEQLLEGIEQSPTRQKAQTKPSLEDTLNLHQSFMNVNRTPSVASFHGDKRTFDLSLNMSAINKLNRTGSMSSLRKSSMSSKRSTMGHSRRTRNSFVGDKTNPLKKLVQCTLPDKYKRIVDDMAANRLVVLDLSNCQLEILGLAHMLELAQDLHKVRTVKLIKCRLTDATMEQLWRYFKHTTTVNLSQNHLTDRTLESLATWKPHLPSLRSVVLSQNLIKERTVRPRLQQLGRLGLSVTL